MGQSVASPKRHGEVGELGTMQFHWVLTVDDVVSRMGNPQEAPEDNPKRIQVLIARIQN